MKTRDVWLVFVAAFAILIIMWQLFQKTGNRSHPPKRLQAFRHNAKVRHRQELCRSVYVLVS
jgi:hypothetical protein